ncbi:MAG: TonB-dependent receptor [Gammaproteobacteria bacterium]|nr:TonB-dependent receptor [Gammaproteobacteria bacterium]
MPLVNRRAPLWGVLALVGSPAVMQDALAQDQQAGEIEEVVVTGTRIRDPNVISSSQITTVQAEDIADRGITRVEDYLNDLPQVSPGQAITASNGSSGTATVNVRNLGCPRTLVLINGQRLAPGTTGGGNCADLNSIPTLLLERVEVLTGGASSVYGSDAVAGVVNFILDDDFEGFRASYMHSRYQHTNDNDEFRNLVRSYDYQVADGDVTTGETDKFALAFGGGVLDGRGHVTGFIEKTDTSPILQGDYDISACALTRGKSACGGSSTIPPGRWADFGGYSALGYVNTADPSVTGLDLKVLGDEFVPRAGQTFNYNPTNFFQRPDVRLNVGFFGDYQVTDTVEAYASVRSMRSESNAQIAYSGTFGNITSLPCYNPLLSKQQYDTVCGNWAGMGGDHAPDFPSTAAALAYLSTLAQAVGNGDILGYRAPLYSLKRNVEGGPRQNITTYENTVSIYGVRGDLGERWSFDISYQSSDVEYTSEYRNDLSVMAINRAIDVVSVNGTPTCVAALNGSDPACIPYNLFRGGMPGDGGIQGVIDGGEALQRYIANSTFVLGTGRQRIVQAVVSGETAFALPGAPSGISTAIGIETKDLSTDFRPDRPSRTGDRSGSGGATLPLAGGYDVTEYFVELGIPVRDNLSVDAGYRYADYSTGNTTDTFKLGAFWEVHESIALRGSYQSAIRHASLYELFRAQGFNLVDLADDPCGLSMSASRAACANTGLPEALYGTDLKSPADQYNILQGGRPDVEPEEASSFTAGLVATPAFIEGLTVTLDYFQINVEKGIGTIPAATALDKCLDTGIATFCDLINRNPVNGSLWLAGGYISAQTTNLSEETVEGLDIIFDYTFDTRLGLVTVEGVTTNLWTADLIELVGEAPLGCAGHWGAYCGKNPQPKWSGNYKATLQAPRDLRLSVGLRYLGETEDLGSNEIDFEAETYWDLTAEWQATDHLLATAGVSNLFDTDPQVSSDAGTAPGNGNTFPAFFDALGRYMFVNVGVSF